MGFVPTQSVERVVFYARSRGLTTFAGLVPNGTYGQRASQAMIRAVEASGGKLVAMQNFDRSAGSISAAVTKLALNGQYDAILVADSGRVALQIVPAIRRSGGATAKVLGTELWNTEGDAGEQPGDARGLVRKRLGHLLQSAFGQISRALWQGAVPACEPWL